MPSAQDVRSIVGEALATGRLDLAEPWREKLLGNGDDAASLTLLGRLCAEQGDIAAALAYLGEAARLDPFFLDAQFQRGNLFCRIGAFQAAIDAFERVLLFVPFHDQALGALVYVARSAGRLPDAIYALKRRIRIGGETDEIQNMLGLCSHGIGDLHGALTAYSRAAALSPHVPLFYSNMATIFYHFERYDDALAQLRRALQIDPKFATAWYHIGNVLKATRKVCEAEDAYRHAIAINPDYAEAHFALGCSLLAQDKWSEGWSEYEWRWRVPGLVAPIHADIPLWQGEEIRGRRILVVAEQGSGDSIQYIRYTRELIERGAHVAIWAPPEITSLFRRIPDIIAVAPNRFDLPQCDYFIPAMSLPRLLKGSIGTLPPAPYLTSDPELRARFSRELGPRKKQLRIGLAWAGNPVQVEDAHRSAKLVNLAPLFTYPRIRWISLQKDARREEIAQSGLPIEDWSDKLDDYHATAALMQALDGVVSVCSSPIHLAGALGVRSVAMLAWAADWRWREDDTSTPYYPSMRITRMTSLNAWNEVAAQAAEIVSSWKA